MTGFNLHEFIHELQKKIMDQLSNPVKGRTFGHLMMGCGLKRGRYLANGLPDSRALDRALQRLRCNGKIRFVNRQWEIVPASQET